MDQKKNLLARQDHEADRKSLPISDEKSRANKNRQT